MATHPSAVQPQGSSSLAEFEALYAAEFGFVWRVLRRFGVPDAQLEDAVHDVFLVWVRRHRDFAGGAAVRTFLYGIARRVAADARRAARRVQRRHEALAAVLVDRDDSVERTLETQHALAVVDRALGELSEVQREVYLLAEVEGLSAQQIGAALSISPNTASSRLRLARQHLAAVFGAARPRRDEPPAEARARVWAGLLPLWSTHTAAPAASSVVAPSIVVTTVVGALVALLVLASPGGRSPDAPGQRDANAGAQVDRSPARAADVPTADADGVTAGADGVTAGADGVTALADKVTAGADGVTAAALADGVTALGDGVTALADGVTADALADGVTAGALAEWATAGAPTSLAALADGATAGALADGVTADALADGATAGAPTSLADWPADASARAPAEASSSALPRPSADGSAPARASASRGAQARTFPEGHVPADRSRTPRGGSRLPAGAADAAPEDPLAREARQIAEAQRLLRGGRLDEALAVLDAHAADAPHGRLADERETLRAAARCRRGDRDALAAAERWFAARPDAAALATARALCRDDE
jgi:RNA polymerase sigma-70 factor (ECF subfamily)